MASNNNDDRNSKNNEDSFDDETRCKTSKNNRHSRAGPYYSQQNLAYVKFYLG